MEPASCFSGSPTGGQGIIQPVSKFRFSHPVEVRYSDLGARLHVNNARYLSYLEEGRIHYRRRLGLRAEVGVILADVHIHYLKPIFLDNMVRVGVRVARIGNKSIHFEHIVAGEGEVVYAEAEAVMVTYDYALGTAIPVPEDWRALITEFEEL